MQYDFNLEANGSQFIDVKGRFFKYKNGTGKIRVRNSTGGYIDLLPGQGVNGLNYSSLSITDLTGAQNTGYLLAGDYEFSDSTVTISSGTVAVASLPGVVVAAMPNPKIVDYLTYSPIMTTAGAASGGVEIVSAANNRLGVLIHRFMLSGPSVANARYFLQTKSGFINGGVPTYLGDSEVISSYMKDVAGNISFTDDVKLKVAAGNSVSIYSSVTENTVLKTVIYTLL